MYGAVPKSTHEITWLLRCKLPHSIPSKEYELTPEQLLACQVIRQAVEDIVNYTLIFKFAAKTIQHKEGNIAAAGVQALRWMFQDRDESPCSFAWWVSLLGLEPDAVRREARKEIRRRLEKRLRGQWKGYKGRRMSHGEKEAIRHR